MILVTGGTGLVGAHLLLDLLKAGNKVRAIYRKSSNLLVVKKVFSYYLSSEETELYFSRIDWQEANLNDISDLTKAFKGISYVYHSAALISFDPADEKALRKINIEGTANIVNLCISGGIRKLCFISSISTMDLTPGEKEISENFTWYQEQNHSDYAISKHGAEIEVWRGCQEGVPVVILNPGVIIGPGFWDSGSGQIFNRIDAGLNYHFPKTTGFVGVRDVVSAAIRAMESKIVNEQYIIVAENLKFKKVLEMIAKSIDKPAPKRPLKPWMVFIGWIYQYLAGMLFGKKRQIAKKDIKTLFEHTFYSNQKFISDFDFQFDPVKQVIQQTGKIFREQR
ncbi:NAD-dependent epimerase/dehydratase family protein [Gillisia limnaea]|uniref:NAD-dependent epimerase/dehydratase n=1 Tax=Gillisia limnaea (strain DSM 15749 / LMG 21470 / R-8282) TaxID=865937 RepID=H2BX93_GILLR|nr:NAD-dependent epimerase/dehydratase family protein [Gillisia limnaea]EHQ03083.1 NAD-dependent epimerase/dehydratase [Gillisia limnaea DSM 15749]